MLLWLMVREQMANYQGIPKHLIEINGESLLERIVRLLKKIR